MTLTTVAFNIHEPGNVKGEGAGDDGPGDFKFHEPEAGEGDFHFHEPEAGRGDFDFHEPNDGEPDEEEVQVPPAPLLRGSEGELYVNVRSIVFVAGLLHVVSTLTEKMDSAMHHCGFHCCRCGFHCCCRCCCQTV